MKVILKSKIKKLGNIGDIVEVKDGYAKNMLIPNGLALFYTDKNYEAFKIKKAEIEKENQENKAKAEELKDKILAKEIILIENAGDDGKLYVQKREVLRVIDTIKRCAYEAVNEFHEVQDENVKNQRLENHVYLFGCGKDLSLNMRRFETKQATKQLYDLVASMMFENGSSMMLINSIDKSMEFEKEWQNLQNVYNLGRK